MDVDPVSSEDFDMEGAVRSLFFGAEGLRRAGVVGLCVGVGFGGQVDMAEQPEVVPAALEAAGAEGCVGGGLVGQFAVGDGDVDAAGFGIGAGVQGRLAVVLGGEGPAGEAEGDVIAGEGVRLPGIVVSEEVDVREVLGAEDFGEYVEVLVTGDEEDVDSGLLEALEAMEEGCAGFEEAVVAVDDVAGEDEDVVVVVDGCVDEAIPGESGGGDVWVDVCGLSADVDIAGSEDVEHGGGV